MRGDSGEIERAPKPEQAQFSSMTGGRSEKENKEKKSPRTGKNGVTFFFAAEQAIGLKASSFGQGTRKMQVSMDVA
jgi:hypothetical protein